MFDRVLNTHIRIPYAFTWRDKVIVFLELNYFGIQMRHTTGDPIAHLKSSYGTLGSKTNHCLPVVSDLVTSI